MEQRVIDSENFVDVLHQLVFAADEDEGLASHGLVLRESPYECVRREPCEQPKVVSDRQCCGLRVGELGVSVGEPKEVHLPALPLDAPIRSE